MSGEIAPLPLFFFSLFNSFFLSLSVILPHYLPLLTLLSLLMLVSRHHYLYLSLPPLYSLSQSIFPSSSSPPLPPSSPVFLIAKSMLKVREQGVSGTASEHGYPLPPLPRNLCVYVSFFLSLSLSLHTNTHILPSVPSQPVLKHNHQAS